MSKLTETEKYPLDGNLTQRVMEVWTLEQWWREVDTGVVCVVRMFYA